MTLRWKIFLLALAASLIMGLTTTTLFLRSWQRLATGYALLELRKELERPDADRFEDFGGWVLRGSSADPQWIRPPAGVSAESFVTVGSDILDRVRQTKLDEGSFEIELAAAPYGRQILSFRRHAERTGEYRVLGLSTISYWQRVRPWLLPFLTALSLVMLVIGSLAFVLSRRLERDYRIIERALENMGAGRLQNLELPEKMDQSLTKLIYALRNTSRILEERDSKIAEVSALAFEDPMTKAPNYRAFDVHVRKALSLGPQTAESTVLAIIDLDFFKKVNDTHGHPVGDFVLQEASRRIRTCVRSLDRGEQPSDFFARYGGEEFVLVFHHVKPGSELVGAFRVLQALRSTPFPVPAAITESKTAVSLTVTASIGVVRWEPGWAKEEWVKEADLALYEAKRGGRNRVIMLRPHRREEA
jgi:diguanylate cyclase (GGDEF)-like protein